MKQIDLYSLKVVSFCIGFAIPSLLILPFPRSNCAIYNASLANANAILTALQSSAAIYVAQQSKQPDKFSDFVHTGGIAIGAKTFSLENIKQQVYEPPALNKKLLTIKFKPDGKATAVYYLNGTDVTAIYTGFN